jgi:hypothetical protein
LATAWIAFIAEHPVFATSTRTWLVCTAALSRVLWFVAVFLNVSVADDCLAAFRRCERVIVVVTILFVAVKQRNSWLIDLFKIILFLIFQQLIQFQDPISQFA